MAASFPTNRQLARSLRRIALGMKLLDGNPFKIRAYEKGADALRGLAEPVAEALAAGQSPKIDGIGKGLLADLKALVHGQPTKLTELETDIPEGIWELAGVSGLGPKKVQQLWQAQLTSPQAVLEAAEAGSLAQLKGWGEKTQAKIAHALLYHSANQSSWKLPEAEAFLATVREALGGLVVALVATGEMRRNCPVVEHWHALLVATDLYRVHVALEKAGLEPEITQVGWHLTESDNRRCLLQSTVPERFGTKLFQTTGHPDYVSAFPAELPDFATESEVFAYLNRPVHPPELRETAEDAAVTDTQNDLLTEADLVGILHNHSTYSDGVNSLQEMAEAARERGYRYLLITDHSQSAVYADGLKPDKVRKQWAEIDALNSTWTDFRILKGIESDILRDGSLDYPDELLAGFDLIIASIHGQFNMTEAQATERLITAIQNPYTSMLGHPTGRLLLNRPGYPINHKAVIDAAAEAGVAIELNSNPARLDLDWAWIPYALERGVKLAICPDAHATHELDYASYGVRVGRKGRLRPEHVLNCLSAEALLAWAAQRRERASAA